MKFDRLKIKAQEQFLTLFNRCAFVPGSGVRRGGFDNDNDPSFNALLPFVRMLGAEREELRKFADDFENPKHWDLIAHEAKAGSEWNQMLLRAREEGLKRIDNWDVRAVGSLIDLFPECVPKRDRTAAISCYMADDEDCTWMVEFDPQRERRTSWGAVDNPLASAPLAASERGDDDSPSP